MLRFYFVSLCIVVCFAPLFCIAAAAATCVLVIQIIAILRTILMHRDAKSLDFLIDDCRSLFELFVHIIGSIPAGVIAFATFPLVAGILLLNHVEASAAATPQELTKQHAIVILSAGRLGLASFDYAWLFRSECPGNTLQQRSAGGLNDSSSCFTIN